jgi:hypothetical protein
MPVGVRYRVFSDSDLELLARDGLAALNREKAHLAQEGHQGALPPAHYLAISGGGDKGAFAAGLLNGWTEAGNRPEFKVVTGISTGSLIAPFAFLGPEYDEVIKTVYTEVSARDIYDRRSIWAAIFNDALLDTRPLRELIGRYVTEDLLQHIAREYEHGRFLLIGTVDLDFQRPVIWNMGAIASSGHPQALQLFQSLMVASASIPGAFPPVMIDVTVDGKTHQEMHVDGGVATQVFVYPAGLNVGEISQEIGLVRERKLYVIRNARLDPDWATVDRRALNIVARAISSLIQYQGINDLYRLYLTALKDGVDYNLAYIGDDFDVEYTEDFDPTYMRQLFDYGYQLARKGYPWQKFPPGYTGPARRY